MSSNREPLDYCPVCGVAYEPLQEYCLECGARLPSNRGVVGFLASRWQRRFARYPGDWMWPVLFFLLLTAVAAAAAVAAGTRRTSAPRPFVATADLVTVGPGAPRGTVPTATVRSTLPAAPAPTITTGPLPTAPGAPSTGATTATARTTTRPNPNALATWPVGTLGFTDVIESVPVAAGRARALTRARAAKKAGLPEVGILVSSQYSSLHPGYFVIFSGIYGSNEQAIAALAAAHANGYPDAYQTKVTR